MCYNKNNIFTFKSSQNQENHKKHSSDNNQVNHINHSSDIMLRLLFIILILLTSFRGYSQGFSFLHTNFYYHDSTAYVNPNGIWSIYADTDRIFTNIDAGAPNNVYIGVHDYEGNQLFLKRINYPKYKVYMVFSGYNQSNTLTKISNNEYLSAGYGYDTSDFGFHVVNRPYLYFFDRNGDSIRFLTPLNIGVKSLYLDAVHYDTVNKEIIVTGHGSSDTGVVKYSNFYESYYFQYDYWCYWTAKFTDKGELIWFKEIKEVPGLDMQAGLVAQPFRILPATDGGYVICGKGKKNYPAYDGEKIHYDHIAFVPALTKIDKDGNLLWHKHLQRDSFPAGASEITQGNALWDICSDGADGYYFVSNYAIPRDLRSDSVLYYYTYRFYYGRLNANGDTLWTKTYIHEADGYYGTFWLNIGRQKNGDIVIGGTLMTFGVWDEVPMRPVVFCTDSTGNVKWYREPRHFDDQHTQNIMSTLSIAPNGNILGGGALIFGSQTYHPQAKALRDAGTIHPGWLFMMDNNGYRCEEDTEPISGDYPCHEPYHIIPDTASGKYVNVKVYPIPARDILYIELQGERHKNTNRYTAYLCDITGRALIQGTIENRKQAINLRALSAGIYILRITKDGELIGTYKVSKI